MTRPWSPLRTPTFWLVLVVVAVSALGVAGLLAVMAVQVPRSALAVVPPLTAYTAVSLAGVRYLDQLGRRPWWLVLLALTWGGTAAVIVGAAAGYTLDVLLAQLTSVEFAADWGAALVAPTAEETAKGAGVLLLLLAARPHLRTVMAGAVYGAVVGVGFAVVEDASYSLTAADETLPDDRGAALRLFALRAALPGLVSHPLFTAVVGAGIAYALVRTDRRPGRRWAVLAGCAALAWLAHAAVNSPVAGPAAETLDRLPGVAPLAGYFLVVGLPGALAGYALARLRRHEAVRLTGQLAAPPQPGVPGPVFRPATGAEAALLATVFARTGAILAVRRRHGTPAARALRRLHAAQLAFLDVPAEPAPHPGWPVPPVPPAATPGGRARAELAAARASLAVLTGSAEGPGRAEPTDSRPSWRSPAVLGVGLAGLVHWVVPLLAGLALLRRDGRHRSAPVAVAVLVTGYVWLAGFLLLLLYPNG